MRVSEIVSEGFIRGVGITRPRPGQERLATVFICTALAGALGVVACMAVLIARIMF